ncbi:hypothetical protein HUJ04_011745 [Dendroctonus ponderosae]|nr:hypothetical protein HUJ04_011745 [Dendroctonus ponderosae]
MGPPVEETVDFPFGKYVRGLRLEIKFIDLCWMRFGNGKRILESWNCFTWGRLVSPALTCSTLMICNENSRMSLCCFGALLEILPEWHEPGHDDEPPYPDRESYLRESQTSKCQPTKILVVLPYLSQIPKFFIFVGVLSGMGFSETISPVDFLNFFNCLKKYQNLDLATIGSGAKIRILYKGVVGSFSVGSLRPMTSYSFSCREGKLSLYITSNIE